MTHAGNSDDDGDKDERRYSTQRQSHHGMTFSLVTSCNSNNYNRCTTAPCVDIYLREPVPDD